MDFLWLEELDSPESLAWIAKENALTIEDIKKHPGFQQHYEEGLEIFSSKNRLGFRYMRQNMVYKVHVSEENPIGQWMRISYEDYKSQKDSWELIFDFDQFSKEQGKQWVYKMASFSPSYQRVLLSLSLEDGDRCWIREFDMNTKQFVPNGFEVPLSKAFVSWFEEDTIFIGGDTPDTQTKHGYARKLSLWKRGETHRTSMLEISIEEQSVYAHDVDEGGCIIGANKNWDEGTNYWVNSEKKVSLLNLPVYISSIFKIDDEIVFKIFKDHDTFKAGSILKATLESLIHQPKPQYELLWAPTATKFSADYVGKRGKGFFCFYRENVATKISYFKKENGKFIEFEQKIPQGLEVTTMHMHSSAKEVLIQAESFTSAPALYEWDGKDQYTKIRSMPSLFAGEYEVSQKWTTSRDGTKIPYFLIHKPGLVLNGKNPTLQYGYGGFLYAQTPAYAAGVGKGWLEKGGVYAVANIRGGDEFGEEWSFTARKENKQRSYDDFIAVAEDLIATKVTSPRHLAIKGGSNGGLLVGAVSMQRPELFSAVLCMMPLLDMIRYTALPPGAIWASEYGDPADPEMRAVIEKYSPYQNIRADRKYPPILFFTSKADDRVHPSHARRMAAKMKTLGHHCFLYEEPTGGHNGGDVKVKAFGDALMYSYLWKHLV